MLDSFPRKKPFLVEQRLICIVIQEEVLNFLEVEVNRNVQRCVLGLAHRFVRVGPGFEQELNDVRPTVVNSSAKKGVTIFIIKINKASIVNYKVLNYLGLVDFNCSSQLLRDLFEQAFLLVAGLRTLVAIFHDFIDRTKQVFQW